MHIDIEFLADYSEFVPVVATWYFNEWGYQEPGNTQERLRARLATKLNRDRVPITIIALADGKPVGSAQLKPHEMEIYPGREFWLGAVYVDAQVRNQGIGSQLVAQIEEIAKRLGIHQLFLQTERLDGGLYARLGWSPLEQVSYRGVPVLIMHKEL